MDFLQRRARLLFSDGAPLATHVRISNPILSHTLFGVYLGIALWGGLWLRDARVRTLLPVS